MSNSPWEWTLTRLLSSCLVATISVVIAVIITLNMGAIVNHTATLFFCSVMLSSWYGGLLPGFLAALLSLVALDYFFIPPLYAFGISLEEAPDIIAFVATALFISWLNGDQKRAKEFLRQAHDELEAKVRDRTAELEKAKDRLRSEIAERVAAEEGLIRAQAEIARIARVTTMGEFAASVAHELNQPLGGIVTSGDACLRWLAASLRTWTRRGKPSRPSFGMGPGRAVCSCGFADF
jgi:signal transduction histidine kinase